MSEIIIPSFDDIYMTMVYLIASKSKDESSKLGAVVVGPKNELRTTGYNGFVRGMKYNHPERLERPEKYFWFEHAERNAIYNATLVGISLDGCKRYTNGVPCMDCARGVIQSGIKEVVVDVEWDKHNSAKWVEHDKKTLEMFNEIGITLRYYSRNFIDIYKFQNGQRRELKG